MEIINDEILIKEGISRAVKEINKAVEEIKVSVKKKSKKKIQRFVYDTFKKYNSDEKREYITRYLNWRTAPNLWDRAGKNLLPDLKDLEKLLYTTNKFYRDHLFHTFRVWGLGLYLYYQGIKDAIQDSDNFHLTWFMASVFHDVGYPIHELKSLQKTMEVFKCYGLRVGDLVPNIQKRLNPKEISKRIGMLAPHHKHIRKFVVNQPHGLISARLLMRAILRKGSIQRKRGYKKNRAAVEAALTAIIDHDRKDTVIDFDKNPYSALLVICDELQEWGRPYITSLLGENEKITSTDHIELKVNRKVKGMPPCIKAKIDYSKHLKDLRKLLDYDDKKVKKDKNDSLKRLKGIKVDVKLKFARGQPFISVPY